MSLGLRILTANLWNGAADPDALADLVHAEGVDVACVQELTPDQADALAEALPHGRLEPAYDHTGMGIALRFPAKPEWLPLPYRAVRAARLDPKHWPGLSQTLAVWNVHVRAPHQRPVLRSQALRRRQLRGLLGHLRRPGDPRLVLVGDFNATPAWPLYRRVAAELSDVAAEIARERGERPARTWGPRPGSGRRPLLRIDHAFARGVRVQDARTVHIPGSDHDGLLVEVALG